MNKESHEIFNLLYYPPGVPQERMASSVKQLRSAASVTHVCMVEDVKTSVLVWIVHVLIAMQASDVSTSTTLARQTPARTEPLAPMMLLDLSASVHRATPANTVMKTSLTAKRIHVHQAQLALIWRRGSTVNVHSIWLEKTAGKVSKLFAKLD